jgi:multicomponent Na+:H+ antiporter subunit F
MAAVLTLIQVLLGVAAAFALIRAVRGPDLIDRIVALDLVLLLVAGGLAAQGVRTGSQLFIGALIVVALVAFAGTVLVARFIEWRDAP